MKSRTLALLLTVGVAVASWPLFFHRLDEGSLAAYDEAVYAEIARETYENSHYLITHYHGRPYVEKPPLCIWAMALSYRLLGVGELGARVPSALFGWLAVLVLFFLGRRMFGTAAGVVAAALLASSDFYLLNARQAMTDSLPLLAALLVAWGTLDGQAGKRSGPIWIGLGLALGFMSKYVIGLLPLGFLLLFALWQASLSEPPPLRGRDWRRAGLLFALLGLPWYLALAVADWPRFSWLVFDYNLALRIEAARPPAPAYWLDLLRTGNPGHSLALLALPALLYLAQERKRPEARLLICACAAVGLFLLSLKYPAEHFLVYLLPWLGLAAGALLASCLSHPPALLPHTGLFLLLFSALSRAWGVARLPLLAPGAWAALLAGLFLLLLFAPPRVPLRRSLTGLLVGLALLSAFPSPPVVDLSPHMKVLGAHLDTLEPPPEVVFLDQLPPYGLQFYTRAEVRPFNTLEEARVPDEGSRRFLITPRDKAPSFPSWVLVRGEERYLGPWALLPLLPSFTGIQPVDVEYGGPDMAWILYSNGDLREHKGRLLCTVPGRPVDMERLGEGVWILTEEGRIHAWQASAPGGAPARLPPPEVAVDLERIADGSGWYILGSGGSVLAMGGARYFGQPSRPQGRRFVSLVATPGGDGYYVVDSLGVAEGFGTARLEPELAGFRLPQQLARDAELRPDTGRLLIMDGYGSLHGDDRNDPVRVPYYTGMEYVIDMEFKPDGGLLMLDTFGSVHGL